MDRSARIAIHLCRCECTLRDGRPLVGYVRGMSTVLELIGSAKAKGRTLLAVLIDPDFGQDEQRLERTVQNACMAKADLIFVGGSLLTSAMFDHCVELVQRWSDQPVVLFPGSTGKRHRHSNLTLFAFGKYLPFVVVYPICLF